jgi:hypothetical protein
LIPGSGGWPIAAQRKAAVVPCEGAIRRLIAIRESWPQAFTHHRAGTGPGVQRWRPFLIASAAHDTGEEDDDQDNGSEELGGYPGCAGRGQHRSSST